MKALVVFFSLLGICVSLPIWFYLIYQILELVNATELMWFLFWVYVPVTFGLSAVTKLATLASEKGKP